MFIRTNKGFPKLKKYFPLNLRWFEEYKVACSQMKLTQATLTLYLKLYILLYSFQDDSSNRPKAGLILCLWQFSSARFIPCDTCSRRAKCVHATFILTDGYHPALALTHALWRDLILSIEGGWTSLYTNVRNCKHGLTLRGNIILTYLHRVYITDFIVR